MNTPPLRLGFHIARRFLVATFLLVATLIALAACDQFTTAAEHERVVQRYNEFRGAVASGETERIMQFVAPEFRTWAKSRLHSYENFALPLDEHSTVSVSFDEATICPVPGSRFLIIFREGHVIKMVRHNGEWFLGRVFID